MYCLTCGYKIEGNPKFCPECGSRLEGNVSEEAPERGAGHVPVGAGTAGTREMPSFPEFGPGTGFFGMLGMNQQSIPVSMEEMMRKTNSAWVFEYSTSGMMYRSGVTYRAWKNDDKTKTYVQVRLSGVDLKDAPVFEADEGFADALEMILTAANASAWDGFNGHAKDVMDGDSFSLSFRDGNGSKINASGYMAWPEGFGAARAGWDALFYGEYDKHFPNYAKRLQDYINKIVFQQYGKCENDAYEVHYTSVDQDSFNYTASNMPAGIITYRIGRFSQPRANDDTDKTWIEALLVRSFKSPRGTDSSIDETGLILELYRSDAEGVRKVLEQTVYREVVIADEGETEILFRENGGKPVIGIYRNIRYHYGSTYKSYYIRAIDLTGGTWNVLGEAHAQTGAHESIFSDEDLLKFTEVMEMIGLSDTAANFKESKEEYSVKDVYTRLVKISWFCNLDSEFAQKTRETEPGKEVDGYRVRIIMQATDYYFG